MSLQEINFLLKFQLASKWDTAEAKYAEGGIEKRALCSLIVKIHLIYSSAGGTSLKSNPSTGRSDMRGPRIPSGLNVNPLDSG